MQCLSVEMLPGASVYRIMRLNLKMEKMLPLYGSKKYAIPTDVSLNIYVHKHKIKN